MELLVSDVTASPSALDLGSSETLRNFNPAWASFCFPEQTRSEQPAEMQE